MGKRQTAAAQAAAAAAEELAKIAPEEAPEPKRKGGTAKFKKGSKVLVPHVDQYYEAVVLQGQKRPEGQYYLLHYAGWSNKYNEWVEEAGVVRYDRALLEQSAAAAGNEPGDLTGRRRKADIAPAEPALAVEIPQQLRLHIPALLKKVVLDDSAQVNIAGKLLPLPRTAHGRPTVADILKEYEAAVAKDVGGGEEQDPEIAEAVREMVSGVRSYFDAALRHFLLYSHEVQQAEEVLGPQAERGSGGGSAAPASRSTQQDGGTTGPGARRSRPASEVYGAEHLVRLLVKLPELVPVAYMTPPDVVRLEQQLHDLMARMTEVKRQARYFSLPEEYQPNPHFNALLALSLQAMLGVGPDATPGAAQTGPSPGPEGASARGAATPAGALVAATAGGAPSAVAPDTGPNSEAGDMEQD